MRLLVILLYPIVLASAWWKYSTREEIIGDLAFACTVVGLLVLLVW